MNEVINNSLFGILLCLSSFEIGLYIQKKFKSPLFNPLLIAILLIITFLSLTGISYESFNKGGEVVNMLLGPATVVLAVPLYKQLQLLKKHFLPIFLGIFIGSFVGLTSIIILSKLFNLSSELTASLIPKSVTTAIGIEVSVSMGGISSITVAAIIITGIIGAVAGPLLCRIFNIKNEIAVGVAMGTAAHAMGTTKALEMGEIEGAMSSLSIGIAGIITVFLAPILIYFSSLLPF
ncbi:MAG: LrgB family protein [Clostridiaceae bacterium]